ncbi:Sulfur carrier protein adenylyltransferase ThiF [Prochlorococcus marinus str. MIT 9321]|uniref:Sulfur carrier protein adenylyltransferase ThiF n=1 Tax=Prochlorococcus marinus str. MIT 9401 TaxID=167551 RepID=A0A0A2B871_PROMR|nr:molybdopterin-synthase adenylyltransferase MoeB [Prochlorococcus marinus]KGG03142.1 Sulfur carrier protein adenylyltransferase ThiF [Prochlorococcus marinus str. MIT 9321]KGG06552.1 Sulfur carrier protein adenylyltransferase ThiF [Prochlorococcus marinus str. MIT 9322]KGG10268.1 Sulfur carrier protein adenylyltransferase ThiF [Prochlorococcus marinus str. MIT 9401]
MSKDNKFNFLNSDEEERYQKHLILNEIGYEGQLNLKNSSVLCIGAGGLGSSVLLYLAATGIGKIGIVDNDQVEKSNLQRQIIHETNSVGNLKIDSARERIKKLNPNCELLTFSERINPKNALKLLKDFDVICDCSDNFGTRYLINDSCMILNKPLVFGSVQGFEGQVSVFNLYKNSPNLRDLIPESPSKNAIPSCAEYGVMGVSTGLIGILQVNEIIKIILKKGEILDGKILIFNLLSMNMKKLHLKSEKTSKGIKSLSQFEGFYDGNEYCEKKNENNIIDVNDFNNLYQTKPNKILLIDVRENEEFSTSSIKGSISIPLSHLNKEYELKFIQKESLSKEIFTICKSGKRSEKASRILSEFKIDSRSIEGGIEKVKKIFRNKYF